MKDEKEGLMSKITEGGLSRRQFLTGSALTAGAVASLGRMCPKSADGGTRDRRERSSSHRRRRHYRTRPCSPVESSV